MAQRGELSARGSAIVEIIHLYQVVGTSETCAFSSGNFPSSSGMVCR